MAFSTFGTLRTRLNSALGLSSDSDNQPFGPSAVRDDALKKALAELWPTMARLRRETITLVSETYEYTLSTLKEPMAVEVIYTGGTVDRVAEVIKTFRWERDEAAEPATIRIRFEALPSSVSNYELRVIGYSPYLSTFASDATSLDLPPEQEWIVLLGAQAHLYRRKLNERLNFQQHAVAGRENDTTVNEIIAAYQLAKREFEEAIEKHRRPLVAAKADRVGRAG